MEIQIVHQPDEKQFVCNLGMQTASLKYSLSLDSSGRKQIDFFSTYVPNEFRGKGVAEKLVRTGLAWAKQEGYEISASCWYAARFLK